MKMGNQRINISFIEILGVLISIVGIILFLTLDDPLLSILSVCVSAMCVLGLSIKINTKLNTATKNQFAPSPHYKKSNIKQANKTSADTNIDDNSTYEKIQMSNKGFVIVNRAESSIINSPQSTTPLHSYDADETDNYETNIKAYSIVSADITDNSPTTTPTPEPAISPTPEIDSSNEEILPAEDILTECNTEEIDTIKEDDSKQASSVDLFATIEETVDLPMAMPDNSQVSTPPENVEAESTAIPQIDNTPKQEEPLPAISNTPDISPEDAKKQNIELHVSNMLAIEQHANPSLTALSKITAKLLVLMSQTIRYTTAGFVWIDYEKQHLILESYICDSQIENLIIEQFPINNNKFTEIITTGSPLLITEKYQPEAEQQHFQYYSQPIGIKSFIGIPIIHNDTIAAILFVDTNKYKYGEFEYQYMQSFSQSFSSLISLYDASISNENATQTLEAINGFSSMGADGNINNICSAITNFVWNHYGHPNTGVVTYNLSKELWTINSYRSKELVSNNFLYEPINIEQVLIGASINKLQQVLLSTVPQGFVRVNEHENNSQNVSFISIPIKSATVCYGALFIESSDTNLITNVNSKALETLCNQAGDLLEHTKLMRLFDNYVSTEINTDILTRNAFNRTIETEITRAFDTNSSLFLVFVALDEYSYFSDNYKKTQIFQYIIELLKAQIKPFELIGRVTENVVGLLLFNRDIHHVELMMETIRRKLATQYIEINKEKLSATISVGINELGVADNWKSFTTNATTALKFAQKKTNSIKTYQ